LATSAPSATGVGAAATNIGGTLDKHKAALDHALAALSDGSGHDTWGPGPVGAKLWALREGNAAEAFYSAALVLLRLGIRPGKANRARFIACMRKVAPVLLEALGDDEVCGACRMSPCHPLCGSQLKEPLP
jgi:hypothetical protein